MRDYINPEAEQKQRLIDQSKIRQLDPPWDKRSSEAVFPANHVSDESTDGDRDDSPRGETCDGTERAVDPKERRIAPRFEVTARVQITIFAESDSEKGRPLLTKISRVKLVREGFTKDLSMSGLCVMFDSRSTTIPLQQVIGCRAKLRIYLTGREKEELSLLGRIAWGKQHAGLYRVGVQFTEVGSQDRIVLEKHCTQDDGELNRISNLWELLVSDSERPS